MHKPLFLFMSDHLARIRRLGVLAEEDRVGVDIDDFQRQMGPTTGREISEISVLR
jgi:hypothetical protein